MMQMLTLYPDIHFKFDLLEFSNKSTPTTNLYQLQTGKFIKTKTNDRLLGYNLLTLFQ